MEDCRCSVTLGSVSEGLLETFAAVRSRCPALHQILVPDEVWPDFQQWHCQPADKVDFHQSILLLAMERGHLHRVTSAVHRYLNVWCERVPCYQSTKSAKARLGRPTCPLHHRP